MYLDRYWHPAYFDAVDELGEAAKQAGRPPIDLAFSWLLRHTPADCVLLGASRIEQLDQNLEAVEHCQALAGETLAAMDAVWAPPRGITPKYNR